MTGDPTGEFNGELAGEITGDLAGEDNGDDMCDLGGDAIEEFTEDLLLGDLTGEAIDDFQDKFMGDGGADEAGETCGEEKFVGDSMLTGDDRIGDLSGEPPEARIGDKFKR